MNEPWEAAWERRKPGIYNAGFKRNRHGDCHLLVKAGTLNAEFLMA